MRDLEQWSGEMGTQLTIYTASLFPLPRDLRLSAWYFANSSRIILSPVSLKSSWSRASDRPSRFSAQASFAFCGVPSMFSSSEVKVFYPT